MNINKGFIYCYSNEMFKYYGNDIYKIGARGPKRASTLAVKQQILNQEC